MLYVFRAIAKAHAAVTPSVDDAIQKAVLAHQAGENAATEKEEKEKKEKEEKEAKEAAAKIKAAEEAAKKATEAKK